MWKIPGPVLNIVYIYLRSPKIKINNILIYFGLGGKRLEHGYALYGIYV